MSIRRERRELFAHRAPLLDHLEQPVAAVGDALREHVDRALEICDAIAWLPKRLPKRS
jgi:hypothetical protein